MMLHGPKWVHITDMMKIMENFIRKVLYGLHLLEDKCMHQSMQGNIISGKFEKHVLQTKGIQSSLMFLMMVPKDILILIKS